MKFNKKCISTIFIFLIISNDSILINTKSLSLNIIRNLDSFQIKTNKLKHPFLTNNEEITIDHELNISELLNQKNLKSFLKMVVGDNKWKEMLKIIEPFGAKWKGKILSVVI